MSKEKKETLEEEIKRYQDILIALGFTRYDNGPEGIAYKLHVDPLQIGRTFTKVIPVGNMWVKNVEDCEYGEKNKFMKRADIKQVPQVDLFYKIRDGELPIPESNVTGKIVGKSEEAVQIQFTEFGETETKWWGLGALKRTMEGIAYIPGSYSKKTKKYDSKMQVPRDILLVDYDTELSKAPPTATGDTGRRAGGPTTTRDTGGHTEEPPEKVQKGTLAEVVHAPESQTTGDKLSTTMAFYLKQGRKMVEEIFPEVNQPQLSELSQDIATSLFIEHFKGIRKERW